MTKEDIAYFDSWSKCFEPASPAIVMRAITEGIWVSSNKDPEDIYKVYPRLIVHPYGSSVENEKQFGMCPFEFSFEDGETYKWEKAEGKPHHKGRMIKHYNISWSLDKYELRKAVTKSGLDLAKEHKITKEEIVALHKKHGWDDEAMYQELISTREDLWSSLHEGGQKYCNLHELAFKDIRAAFCPHFDTLYNWMDYPEKAGFPEIPNIDNRKWEWEPEDK